MILADTSALVAAAIADDPDHERCARALLEAPDDLAIVPTVITEVSYLLARNGGPAAPAPFLRELDLAELQQAYRRRAKAIHPDLHGGAQEAVAQMAVLNRAWEVLRSPEMRAAYDWLEHQRAEAVAA